MLVAVWARAVDSGMAEPGPQPEPGRAWRVFALCGAAVFLAAVAAGAALLAWNLASSASRRPRCPEPSANTTAPPGDPEPEVEELRRRLAEAARLEEALTKRLKQAERVRRELEEALRACEGRQVGGQAGGLGNPENEGERVRAHTPRDPPRCLGFPASSTEGGK